MKKEEKEYSVTVFESSGIKHTRRFLFFWVGFILYFLSYSLTVTGQFNFVLLQGIQTIGLLLIATALAHLLVFEIENKFLKVVYSLYCCWLILLVVRGGLNSFNYDYIKTFLFDPYYGGIIYFIPLILLISTDFDNYKKIFDVVFLFGIIYLLLGALFFKNLASMDRENLINRGIVETFADFSFPCGFLLLTFPYHSKKRKLMAILVMFLGLLFAIIRARRGLILMTSGIIIASYLLYLFTTRQKQQLFIVLGLILILSGAGIKTDYFSDPTSIFGFIIERGQEDTRTGVEVFFYNDLTPGDWAVGKGIRGEYYCPDIEEDAITDFRSVIETGYLQIILKGGLLSLGLLLLILVPAVVLGLFYSKNILSKGAAIWILLSILSLYPATVNAFTLRYLLVWFSVGICYSSTLRNIPEEELRNLLSGNPII